MEELPQVYAPALKPRQVISLFYSTNMAMETIAAESNFDEQGTMTVLYSLFLLRSTSSPAGTVSCIIFLQMETQKNSCCVLKALIFICEGIFSLKKLFLKKNG